MSRYLVVEGSTSRRVLLTLLSSGLAVMFFLTTGIFAFIPYVCNVMKDVQHTCMKCGRVLATRHMGGATESHLL